MVWGYVHTSPKPCNTATGPCWELKTAYVFRCSISMLQNAIHVLICVFIYDLNIYQSNLVWSDPLFSPALTRPIYLSICLSDCLSDNLYAWLSVCRSIYQCFAYSYSYSGYILFYSILFYCYSILFFVYSILVHSVLFWSVLFYSILWYSTVFHSILFCSILFDSIYVFFYLFIHLSTSSTAQGGGGSFKPRKPIGEVGCCESGMAERSHWWTDRWLRSPLFLSLFLSFSDFLPTYRSIYLLIYSTLI